MSRQHISAYRTKLAQIHAASGSLNEGPVSQAFGGLLESWGRALDLTLVQQWEGKGPRGNDIRVDGALVPTLLRVPFGYWEAKDSKDDLDREIAAKSRSGYPDDNIIYENSVTAVLRQNGREMDRAPLQGDDDALLGLLNRYFAYERPEIAEFNKASAQFRADLPQVLEALRMAIGEAEARSSKFSKALKDFLDHAREAINPIVSADDVREMLIQHILTEEIFSSVFDNPQFHRENNIAKKLGDLEAEFFTGELRYATTERLRPYYVAIRGAAADISGRREKQTFLKKLYEDFYKVYNPLAADRLGVVYTPGEIVRFMIRGAEWLTQKHFGKLLGDKDVEILDPATGTGTFIVELLEHMQGAGREQLAYKYKQELHANEVAILPYYVANLNIEATYAALEHKYAEFPGLVFVDTLDNTAGLGIYKGSHYGDLLGSTSDENLARVKRQNAAKISVIIGNPPYNAWQSDYNSRNPNRPYRRVDERIGQTYRARSHAQNTSALSDMYVRFWRWASDRLRDDGVIAFVTNRNYIDKVAFDGFRLAVADEFAEAWIMDLGGDVRANPKLSGTKHNAMGIQTGLAIAFMVRDKSAKGFKLSYARRPEDETAKDKLTFLESVQDFERLDVVPLKPDAKGNWLSTDHPDWGSYLPLADPTKGPSDAQGARVQAIFRLSSNGVQTKRNDWAWAGDRRSLMSKMKALIAAYEAVRTKAKASDTARVKWDADLDRHLKNNVALQFTHDHEIEALFRPFVRGWLYFDAHLNSRRFRLPSLYRSPNPNPSFVFRGVASQDAFTILGTDRVFDLDLLKTGNGVSSGVARYRYTASGERVDNITDWALKQFRDRYGDLAITKDDIFAYCYAALHDPVFGEVHAADLRREFPRVPLRDDFGRWRDWGRQLLDLHIGYEKAKPFKLTRIDAAGKLAPVPKLRSIPDKGLVIVDEDTQLTGIPLEVWSYRLGNRSAIDWVLDQHKEKTPRDPTVRAKFNTYRFADHKEEMINLLARVITVSLETVKITDAMRLQHGEVVTE
ncbi:MAG: type ISP restriction/modification enzyme [Sphingomicrobium sp.]